MNSNYQVITEEVYDLGHNYRLLSLVSLETVSTTRQRPWWKRQLVALQHHTEVWKCHAQDGNEGNDGLTSRCQHPENSSWGTSSSRRWCLPLPSLALDSARKEANKRYLENNKRFSSCWTWTGTQEGWSLLWNSVWEPTAPCEEYNRVQFSTPFRKGLRAPYCRRKTDSMFIIFVQWSQSPVDFDRFKWPSQYSMFLKLFWGDLQSNIFSSRSLRLKCFCLFSLDSDTSCVAGKGQPAQSKMITFTGNVSKFREKYKIPRDTTENILTVNTPFPWTFWIKLN